MRLVRTTGAFDAYRPSLGRERYHLACDGCGWAQKRRFRTPDTAGEVERRKPHPCTQRAPVA